MSLSSAATNSNIVIGKLLCWEVAACLTSLAPQPSSHGGSYTFVHITARSLRAHTSTHRDADNLLKHWQVEFLVRPQDKIHIATPWAFPSGSPVLKQYLEWADTVLLDDKPWPVSDPNHYNLSMEAMQSAFHKTGLEDAFQMPWVCSALDYRCKDMKFNPYGADTVAKFKAEDIAATALCVNNFKSSTKPCVFDDGLSYVTLASPDVHPTSAWAYLVECSKAETKRLFTIPEFSLEECVAGFYKCAESMGAVAHSSAVQRNVMRDASPPVPAASALPQPALEPPPRQTKQLLAGLGRVGQSNASSWGFVVPRLVQQQQAFHEIQQKYKLLETIGQGGYGTAGLATKGIKVLLTPALVCTLLLLFPRTRGLHFRGVCFLCLECGMSRSTGFGIARQIQRLCVCVCVRVRMFVFSTCSVGYRILTFHALVVSIWTCLGRVA